MPREFPRSRRVEEAIQRALSETISAKARDPRLSGVIVTHVRVSRDISVARVYYTMLSGDQPAPEIAEALRAAAGFLRSTLARELRIRHVPELRFFHDEALARSRSLEDLIAKAVEGNPGSTDGGASSGDESK